MQRLSVPADTREVVSSSLHTNRQSYIAPGMASVMVTSVTAMTSLLCMIRHTEERGPLLAQPTMHIASTDIDYSSHAEESNFHSGPFHIEGFDHEVSFLDDGFTIAVNGQKVRLRELKALWSELTVPDIKEKLKGQGITSIECDEELCMHSGDKRSLKISKEDLLRLLKTINEDQNVSVVITGIPYKLTMERGFSTILIPRSGTCELTFDRIPPKPVTIASSSGR